MREHLVDLLHFGLMLDGFKFSLLVHYLITNKFIDSSEALFSDIFLRSDIGKVLSFLLLNDLLLFGSTFPDQALVLGFSMQSLAESVGFFVVLSLLLALLSDPLK